MTPQQLTAIAARGNILVAAGAGTGKTSTVTARCLDLILREQCSVEQILMVTFTEAAAAEMRERIRKALRRAAEAAAPESPEATWLAEQLALLDPAPISTLHSFCLELVRRNFHALGLDPQFVVLDESQTKPLIYAVLDALFAKHYGQTTEASRAVAELVRTYGGGRDEAIRQLVVQIHHHAQSLAAPENWFATQAALFNQAAPDAWRAAFLVAVRDWSDHWRATIEALADQNANVAAAAQALEALPEEPAFAQAAAALAQVVAADAAKWEHGTKTRVRKPIEGFFAGAAFLHELTRDDGAPLAEDWAWSRRPMLALLELAREFGADFARAKRELGGIDFADQEQFALRLLLDAGRPTALAQECRDRFRFVFVDECQDINAAQDAILRAVSREDAAANRFLVGDVKQSIYRFRLANPRIFQDYQERWARGEPVVAAPVPAAPELQLDFFGQPAPPDPRRGRRKSPPPPAPETAPVRSARVLSLTDNFRSREALLQFINPLFRALMRPALGGLTYDAAAELQFGARDTRAALSIAARRAGPPDPAPEHWPAPDEIAPRVELHILTKDNDAESGEDAEDGGARVDQPDLLATEREGLLVARRLKQLQASGHRVWHDGRGFVPVEFRDMVVLMRSTAGRTEVFARAFHREGVPLHASRTGFLAAQEVADVLNLLRLLDNPLQDLPLLAVLRSPFVGLSPGELASVRLAERGELLWVALTKLAASHGTPPESPAPKAREFLAQYQRWRELIRHAPLTQCIETTLAETHYEALLLAGERGPERAANLRRLVELARRFDPFQREGLFRFLQFIAAQEEVEARHEPAELFHDNAVRLMTIHASKGLEFPVVVVAGLGTRFNLRDLGNDILLHEDLGLCPKVLPPESRTKFPGITHWLAAQRERRALLGEELRLLYVAVTRARDTLVLSGAATRRDEITRWEEPAPTGDHALVKAACFLDWLRLWFTHEVKPLEWQNETEGANELLRWKFYSANDNALISPASSLADRPALPPPPPVELHQLRERLAFRYGHLGATREAAKSSVTTLRHRAAETDDEARPLFPFNRPLASGPTAGDRLSAAEIGTAHHSFLQFVDLAQTTGEAALRTEATRMIEAGLLTEPEAAALDFAALAAFWQSETGALLRSVPPGCVNREMPFTARFSGPELQELIVPGSGRDVVPDDFVVVQGVVDLAVLLPAEIWLLDFKTDRVAGDEVAARRAVYEPQLKLYAQALQRIYHKPATRCWLHFLAAQTTVAVQSPAVIK
jgi:ATP-dependent helicase/nuclease subunit A